MSDIVVGMDASANSAAALRWAIREARLRGVRVRAVMAWAAGARPPEVDEAACSGRLDHLARSARRLLHRVVCEVTKGCPPVEVVERVVYGTPAHALLDASLDAQMLVVGSRPPPATARVFVSSVGDVCTHEATVPVVVVRGDVGGGDVGGGCGDPVVVGVDGSAPSTEALRWVAREAALRRVPLRVVHACTVMPPARSGAAPHSDITCAERAARGTLERCIAECRSDTDGLDVQPEIVGGGAADTLIAASAAAQLLVVGARGHGGFAGLQLGSTSHECVACAQCPVAVVRVAREDRPARRGGSHTPAQTRVGTRAGGTLVASTPAARPAR
jgi:nucleotide-binding universal stress UspA family protein